MSQARDPDPPKHLNIVRVGPTEVVLAWKRAKFYDSETGDEKEDVRIQYFIHDAITKADIKRVKKANTTTAKLKKCEPECEFEFRVYGVNVDTEERTEMSDPVSFVLPSQSVCLCCVVFLCYNPFTRAYVYVHWSVCACVHTMVSTED